MISIGLEVGVGKSEKQQVGDVSNSEIADWLELAHVGHTPAHSYVTAAASPPRSVICETDAVCRLP